MRAARSVAPRRAAPAFQRYDRPVLEAAEFDEGPTRLQVLRFAEAACQHIKASNPANRPDLALLDPDRFTSASYRQHVRILRPAFDQAMLGEGAFMAPCKTDQGIVAFGDSMAYC